MDTPSLTKSLNKIKELGIELTKEVKDLYNKIIKQLRKRQKHYNLERHHIIMD